MNASVVPNLGYRDAAAAIRFLVEAFGFEEVAVYGGEPEASVGHADLRWPGGGLVSLHSAPPGGSSVVELAAQTSAGAGYPAFSVHVTTDEPDALFERAVAAGAEVVREVQDSPFGTRGFIVRDREGLYWSFGTPLPRLARDEQGEWRPAEPPRPA